jgi:L-ascorbate metabolism protein UlaG (beta-lactamase superfamily)
LLIDGFFSRPSFEDASSKRISTDPQKVDDIISRFKMNRVKAVFVAHSHYDHALDAAHVARKTNAQLYGSNSTLNIGRGSGLKEDQMLLFVPGKILKFGKFGVIVLESAHSPMEKSIDDLGKEILSPLSQPAYAKEYVEGGSYDFVIRYNNKTIYVKPSANYIKGMLNTFEADVLFLGIAKTGLADQIFNSEFYEHTVERLRPGLIVPLHWDNFFLPESDELKPLSGSFKHKAEDFDWIIERTKDDKIQFKILQWGKSIILFSETENLAYKY